MNAERKLHLVCIALGSNIAPEFNLPAAVRELKSLGELGNVSSIWQSAPVGDVHQADFCNAAVQLRTSLSPLELKSRLREIESQMGRVRDPLNKNAARTIDLDIAFYDDLVIDEPDCCIPDPDIPDRPFLLVPLMELDARFSHPVLGKTLSELVAGMNTDVLERRHDIALK